MKHLRILLIFILLVACAPTKTYTGRYLKIYQSASKQLSEEDARNLTNFCMDFDEISKSMVKRLSAAFKEKGYDVLRDELIKQKAEWKQIFIFIKTRSNGNKLLIKAKFAYIRNDLFYWAYYYSIYGPKKEKFVLE